jgi:hypothetical protein
MIDLVYKTIFIHQRKCAGTSIAAFDEKVFGATRGLFVRE